MFTSKTDRKINLAGTFLTRGAMFFLIPFTMFFALLFSAPSARANDIYISQSGGGNGSSCSSALPASFFNNSGNWSGGGQIGPGTKVHLCGTISTALSAQGSGSAGNVIGVIFETGSKISLPYCPANGCLELDGQSYITVDGGIPCGPSVANKASCNGIIEANANGTLLANHVSTGTGVRMNNVTNIEVKNLIVRNMYVHASPSDLAPSAPWPSCMDIPGTASQVKIHDNTMHDALWCANTVSSSPADHIYWYHNELYNIGHGFAVGVMTQTDDSIYVYGNYVHDTANWDTAGCAYHDDGIHAFQVSGGLITNLFEYNNVFGGNFGACPTAMIYTEGTAFTLTAFNNVGLAQNSLAIPNGCYSFTVGSGGRSSIYNNTCIMAPTQNNYDIKWEGASDVQNNATANSTQPLVQLPSDVTVSGSAQIDYNAWGTNAIYQGWYRSSGSAYMNFAQWQSFLQSTYPSSGGDSHGMALASPANLGLDSNGRPQNGSPLIGKGHNLSSLCSGQPNPGIGALCYDAAGNARPGGTTSWDLGAYSSGTTATTVAPPSSLVATVQ